MESDWEVEIGPGAPIIDAQWTGSPGFIDLRSAPQLAASLPEAADFPVLAQVLARLNYPESPVWTSKCDVWPLTLTGPDGIKLDPSELNASPEQVAFATACYLDLHPQSGRPYIQEWITPDTAISSCKRFCEQLQAVPASRCRVDLVVRQAVVTSDLRDPAPTHHGVTAYFIACGATSNEAKQSLAAALVAFAAALCPQSTVK